MTNTQFKQLLAALIDNGVVVPKSKQPKAAKKATSKAKPSTKADLLAAKDRKILAGFTKMGIQDVVLMNRADKAKPFNVKPYKGWLADGRIVAKGQHGVMGLFHVSQTQPIG